ncbi:ATP-binding protein [Phycicoccus sp.]|uniref:sensor histidine kinase n=1 Tax=Phycicoccus sp. TaxID=1902410 RepID=UPI002BE914A1|nr:ATP-binding protein [Phycicoccus sp.]HMM96888.1 histidine kinase [Phycicoccus sp.]
MAATDPPPPVRTGVVGTAVRRFVALSAVALVVLGVGAVVVTSRIAEESALHEARLRGSTIANAVAAPLVDSAVRAGDPDALGHVDEVLRARMADASLAHVKLWTSDERVLWSDEEGITGRHFDLGPDELALFGTRDVVADLSDLEKEENVQERPEGELLEVYAGTFDADGAPLVVEAYLSTAEMRSNQWGILGQLLPVTLGVLLLYMLVMVPLAVGLARRVERGEQHRARLLRHSLRATDRERLRIARDLHDGVVQDLAGLRYAMPVVAAHLPDTPEAAPARATVGEASTILARDVEALRSLLVDIHPPTLSGRGLHDAAEDLAERARRAGTAVTVEVPTDATWSTDVARVAYRVLQEGLRNVLAHAEAPTARVAVRHEDDTVHVTVEDDGRGMVEGRPAEEGHVGLTLLRDHLADLGGHLEVGDRDGGGTRLSARIPATWPTDVVPGES